MRVILHILTTFPVWQVSWQADYNSMNLPCVIHKIIKNKCKQGNSLFSFLLNYFRLCGSNSMSILEDEINKTDADLRDHGNHDKTKEQNQIERHSGSDKSCNLTFGHRAGDKHQGSYRWREGS